MDRLLYGALIVRNTKAPCLARVSRPLWAQHAMIGRKDIHGLKTSPAKPVIPFGFKVNPAETMRTSDLFDGLIDGPRVIAAGLLGFDTFTPVNSRHSKPAHASRYVGGRFSVCLAERPVVHQRACVCPVWMTGFG